MDYSTVLEKIKKRYKIIVILSVMGVLLGFGLSFLKPAEYETSFRLMIVQNYSGNMDAFTVARSNEQIGNILKQAIYSNDFINKTTALDRDLSVNDFGVDQKDRLDNWTKRVETDVLGDTGMIAVRVYDIDREQSKKVARAMNVYLTTAGNNYYGGSKKIIIKTIDNPYTVESIVRPNRFQEAVVGLGLGLMVGLLLSVFWSDQNKKHPYKESGLVDFMPDENKTSGEK